MSKNIQVENFENYYHRLHFNTALDLISNSLAIFLVFKYSTKAMRHYKYYILSTLLGSLIMDLHLTVVYGLYPLFPLLITCSTGLAANWGWFWGSIVQWCILHVTFSCAGNSILISIIYQYFSLKGRDDFFQNTHGALILLILTILYPSVSIILFVMTADFNAAKADVLATAPKFYDLFMANSCNSNVINLIGQIYLVSIGAQCALVVVVALIVAKKIKQKLEEMKESLSASTLKMKKTYLKTLVIQISIPVAFLGVPVAIMLTIVVFEIGSLSAVSSLLIQLFTLHSTMNALTVMFSLKPYRVKIIEWSRYPLLPFKRWLPARWFDRNSLSIGGASTTILAIQHQINFSLIGKPQVGIQNFLHTPETENI